MSDLYVADLVIASPSLRGAVRRRSNPEGLTDRREVIYMYGGNCCRRTCGLLRSCLPRNDVKRRIAPRNDDPADSLRNSKPKSLTINP